MKTLCLYVLMVNCHHKWSCVMIVPVIPFAYINHIRLGIWFYHVCLHFYSRDDLNETLKHPLPPPPHIKSSTLNGKSGYDQDFLHQFYYTMPPATGGSVLGGGGGSSQIGVRLAPLAKFDERDFDLPPPSEAKQKVKLFRALLIFFTTVILVSIIIIILLVKYFFV